MTARVLAQRCAAAVSIVLAVAALAACERSRVDQSSEFVVRRTLPHDAAAFTQGLLFHGGRLLESTGLYGASTLREVEIETGRVVRKVDLPADVFGEGLARWSNRLFQLTWREGVVFVHDLETFAEIGRKRIEGEGWGLTVWSNVLVRSDGSATLFFHDPATWRVVRTVVVLEGTAPVPRLNELEVIDGEIWANIWGSPSIVRIDPASGRVLGRVDFSALVPPDLRADRERVLNGIAFDPQTRRLFITGKRWPVLYEVGIRER